MTKSLANVTFTVEERPNPMDELTAAIRTMDETQQVRVTTNGVAPAHLSILLHGRFGKGKLTTRQTGAHELLVWRKRYLAT